MYDMILIRYGELTTKGKNRMDFINKLRDNIKHQIKEFKDVKIIKEYDRMFLELNGTDAGEIIERLKDIFGIHSFSLVKKMENDLDAISEYALKIAKQENAKTFKVDVKRNDKSFPKTGDEIKRLVATVILKNTEIKVDIHNPELRILIEIRKDASYITTSKIKGAGGYPLGMGGKVMLMLSGGIDSPVAAYLLMRKGITVEFVHFATPPHTTEESLYKVMDLVKTLKKYGGGLKLHVIDFTPIQNEIFCAARDSYRITIMRRFFYRIAKELATERGCLAIANGESVGQVASQTLESIHAINDVTNFPILRPLATMDKLEIIDIAEKIGTYTTSIIPHEDCCTLFVPKNPVTRPKVELARAQEEKMFIDGLLEEAVKNRKEYNF